jgi:hypothetical protein
VAVARIEIAAAEEIRITTRAAVIAEATATTDVVVVAELGAEVWSIQPCPGASLSRVFGNVSLVSLD